MRIRLPRRLRADDGVVTIIVALTLVVLLGVTALVVDLGRARHARQQLQDGVDSASISAAAYLPAQSSSVADKIKAMATKITLGSTVGVPASDITTTFWCVLRFPANTPGGPSPDLGNNLGFACGPATNGAWDTAAGWATKGSRTSHPCDPYAGDLCNAIKVQSAQTVKYLFAPAIGVGSGSTGSVQSVACVGACKPTGNPLDIALVLDRTSSMSVADITNVKNAANELLKVYDPAQQSVALLALPYSKPAPNGCQVQSPQEYADSSIGKWRVVDLSNNFKNPDGTLNSSSELVSKIACLDRAASPTIKVSGNVVSGGHTNLGDPMGAAAALLNTYGRPTVPDIVIFMTDGQANQPNGLQPCSYAVGKAVTAKQTADVYTVGYGIGTVKCSDTSGTYRNSGSRALATTALADMATSSTDNSPGSCAADENTDGDNYFCEDRNSDLANVFRQIAIATVKNARIIDVD